MQAQLEGNILQTLSRTLHQVFDATGARLRTVPFRPERVKAALAAARA